MFEFTVKYFGVLKRIPFLPLVFDCFLRMETFFRNREVLHYIDEIEEELVLWENVETSLHKYGGLQFDVNGKEIGHIHSNGLLDILFSIEIKNELISKRQAMEHHIFKGSGWISYWICGAEEKKWAIQLLKKSYDLKSNPAVFDKKINLVKA
jgi:hypothetical protein